MVRLTNMSLKPISTQSLLESGARRPNIALAVVIRDTRVLVQHRYHHTTGMVHEFPGGKADEGETPVHAAMRELKEETGIQIV